MDGTLLDTEKLYRVAWREAAKSYDQTISNELYARLIGLDENIAVETLQAEWNISVNGSEYLRKAERLYLDIIESEGISIRSGIIELLDWFDRFSIRLAVATSTPTSIAIKKLESTGLLERFETVVGGNDVKHGKPAPDIFFEASSRLNADPKNCLAFEDSLAGIESSRSAGMRSVWVPDLYLPSEQEKGMAWAVFDSHHQALDYLIKI